mgnify:CR=1 FL=1
MDEAIEEIYKYFVQEKQFRRDLTTKVEREIDATYGEEWKEMEKKQQERQKEKASRIASEAEKCGFIKGFQYAVRLFMSGR